MYRFVSNAEKAAAKSVSFIDFMLSVYPWDTERESKSSARWIFNSHIVLTASGYFFNGKTCHEHGDGIEFLMKYKGMEYPEAVALLYAYAQEHPTTRKQGGTL